MSVFVALLLFSLMGVVIAFFALGYAVGIERSGAGPALRQGRSSACRRLASHGEDSPPDA